MEHYYVVRAVKTTKKINDDMNDFRDEAFEMSVRNLEERDWHNKMKAKGVFKNTTNTQSSTPVATSTTKTDTKSTTVIHHSSGPNATDVLLAYELGRHSAQPAQAPTPQQHNSSDNGGSSSSWDDDEKRRRDSSWE